MDQHRYDVLVVGCGIAGLSAAVTAAQHGARVAVLERAPREERGGNTRYTESFWRMKSETEVADDFEERFAANGAGHADPALVREAGTDPSQWSGVLRSAGMIDPHVVSAIADDAPHALQWLKGFGVRFDFLPIYFLSQSTTRIAPVGGGLALIDALAGHAETLTGQIIFHYETTARELMIDADGAVAGVHALAAGNRPLDLHASCVVLASGGFEGNQEMLAHYIGPQSAFTRPVARGGYYNRGEGIRMALDAGASPCGNFGSFHAQPVDPRSEDQEPVVLHFAFGGLKIDERARVLNTAGDPIPGLYAAGETVGLYYRVYPGATSVLRGAVTGRFAGRDAALRRNR